MAAIEHLESVILSNYLLCGMIIRDSPPTEILAMAGKCHDKLSQAAGPLEKLKRDISQMAEEIAAFNGEKK